MKPMFTSALLALSVTAGLLAQEGQKESPPSKGDPGTAKSEPQEASEKKPLVLDVGATVPETTVLHDTEGKPFRFKDARGKTVVIHFWSTVCPAEEGAEPKLMKLAKDFAEKDVIVVAIAANQNEIGAKPDPEAFEAKDPKDRPYAELRAEAERVKFNHRILVDHGAEVANLLAARTTPHCFVIDPKGVLVYSGALDDDPRGRGEAKSPYVHDAVTAALEGRDVEPATTRPYG